MTNFVITLGDYVPSPRFPPVTTPWTQARIGYSPTQAGPFTTIDTITLTPVEPDPTSPVERNLTTLLSPAPSGWFQVTFLDAAGNQEPTTPVAFLTVGESRARMREPNQTVIAGAGSTQTSVLAGTLQAAEGQLTWRLINDADGTILIPESTDGIVAIDDGHDPVLRRYQRPYVAPLLAGQYLGIWRYQLSELAETIVVASSAEASFASPEDVAKVGRPLSDEQMDNVPFLLNMAAAVIADAAGFDDGWAVQLTNPPQLLRMLSVQLVRRVLSNPNQYSDLRQQVGSYSFEASWDRNTGMLLSEAEVLMVRRAVHGRTTDSTQIDSDFQRAQDEYWLRKQSARYASSDTGSVIA